MSITVKKTIANKTQTTSRIDLFDGITLPTRVKRKVAREVGELLIDETLVAVGNSKSPLSGHSFDKLTQKYKKFKQSKNRRGVPNLELSGDMLDAFKAKVTKTGLLEMGVFGKDAPKADGHNNLSGKSSLPLRRFLPGKEDSYKRPVISQIDNLIADAVATSSKLPKQRLANIQTKREFFNVMRDTFVGLTQVQISNAILADPDLLEEFTALGLTRFLGSNGKGN